MRAEYKGRQWKIPPRSPGELRRIKEEAEQLIRDVMYWNTHRTDAEPMDCETSRLVVSLADRGLKAAECGDGNEYAFITDELVRVTQDGDRDEDSTRKV